MSDDIDELARSLRPHYQTFLGHWAGDVLLTAHSHQAWPDVARDGHIAAWEDAARLIDGKWARVFGDILPELQARIATRVGTTRAEDLALAPNTHELVYRLLSCFPHEARVLTTDSEFHSLSRQLARSEEAGLRVHRVPVDPGGDFEERFCRELFRVRPHVAALSQVFYKNGLVATRLPDVLRAAAELNIPVLVDSYHAYCALPMDVDRWPGTVFVTAGGYKYAQCGEGTCFMLLPAHAENFRPRNTGWMADFKALEGTSAEIRYGPRGMRFFGATFDPTPLYRALAVLRWMDSLSLDPARLRAASLRKTQHILELYDELDLGARGLDLGSPRETTRRGPFVAFRSHRALELQKSLRARGIHTDARGPLLRLGPAPYTTAAEINRAMTELSQLV